MRDSYKELYLHLKKHISSKEYSKVKYKFKKLELNYTLFEGDSSESSEISEDNETNEDSESEGSLKSDSYDDSASREAKNTYGANTKRAYIYSSSSSPDEETASTKFNPELDENFIGPSDKRMTVELQHLVLKQGASKNISMTPLGVCGVILQEKLSITKMIEEFSEKYIQLIKLFPFKVKNYLELKYFRLFTKSLKYRTVEMTLEKINYVLSNNEINKETTTSMNKRREYFENAHLENARGLAYQTGLYEFYNQPILFEDNWEPEPYSEYDSSSSSNTEEVKIRKPKETKHHLIFLVHGYNGKPSDMKYMRNALIHRHPQARIY